MVLFRKLSKQSHRDGTVLDPVLVRLMSKRSRRVQLIKLNQNLIDVLRGSLTIWQMNLTLGLI